MKQTELRQLNHAALTRLLNEEQEKIRALRFKAGQGELKNVREIRTAKKNVAQIHTVQKSSLRL